VTRCSSEPRGGSPTSSAGRSTYEAEFVALTQLQADALITADSALARAVSGLVETATIDALSA
jgi:hypothetical protein